jgi:hypothetical protein
MATDPPLSSLDDVISSIKDASDKTVLELGEIISETATTSTSEVTAGIETQTDAIVNAIADASRQEREEWDRSRLGDRETALEEGRDREEQAGFLKRMADAVGKGVSNAAAVPGKLAGALGGFLGTAGTAAAGLGIGIGAVGLGIGAAAGGVGYLINSLSTFETIDAEKIKANVLTLLTISDNLGDPLETVGLTVAALGFLGVGLAAFALGSATVGLADALTNFVNPAWAESIKGNVLTLLSIAEDMGPGVDVGIVTGALILLGAGLAVFGVGSATVGLADALTNFVNPGWAESIKHNVLTLLSIAEDMGPGVDVGIVTGSLILLGAGLAVFGLGSATAGLTNALTSFTSPAWAESIKHNVLTLLSIGGEMGSSWDGAIFVALMTAISAGLLVFSAGNAAAGLSDALTSFTNPGWAESIKHNVLTLLSIGSEMGSAWDGVIFTATMAAIGAGLVAFSVGAGMSAAITLFSGDNWAENVKQNVNTLLSITEDAASSPESADRFLYTMRGLAAGILAFTASQGIGMLAGVGEKLLSFFGVSSPFERIMNIAKNADNLVKAGDGLNAIAEGLSKFSNLKMVDLSKLKFEEMAENLIKTLPLLEQVLYGGTIKSGGIYGFREETKFKGILDPKLRLEDAAVAMDRVNAILGRGPASVQIRTIPKTDSGVQLDESSRDLEDARLAAMRPSGASSNSIVNQNSNDNNSTTVNVAPSAQVDRSFLLASPAYGF